jgi:anti-sigma B factor antagonist
MSDRVRLRGMVPRAPSDVRPPTFAVAVRPERERVVVVPTGELDLATSARVEAEIQSLLDRGFAHVVLDLRELSFIDSSGVHLLLRCHEDARQRGVRVSMIVAPGVVSRALELCGVRDWLDVVAAPATAATPRLAAPR